MAQFHHVERMFGYRAFYLMHIPGNPDMEWTPDDEQAFRYEDREEAEQDAAAYDGEISTFEAPDWRGHNAASRLEYRFEIVEGANLQAAE